MGSEEEDFMKQLEEEEKFYKKYESDHIGLQDDSETDSSDEEYYEIFNKKEKQELPFVIRNRIAYIKHCVDDISNVNYDKDYERWRKCRTAIGRLPKKYREEIKEYISKKRGNIATLLYRSKPISTRKRDESLVKRIKFKNEKTLKEAYYERCKKADEKLSNAMCEWLNIKKVDNVHDKYENIKRKHNLLNSLYDLNETLYFRRPKKILKKYK